MIIDSYLSESVFRNFTIFDILKRRKSYRSPLIFASILSVSALICFIMNKIDGAVLLGSVLLIVGLGMPLVYFTTFFASLRKQVKAQNLNPPRLVYTLDLTDKEDGIHIENGKEQVTYKWKKAHSAYNAKDCIYLYLTSDRAFLLPKANLKEEEKAVWHLIVKRLGADKCIEL